MPADQRKKVFFIQRYVGESRIIREMVEEAINESDGELQSLETMSSEKSVIEQIYRAIETADLVICDISDPKLNVMYELGYAHALQKPVILITRTIESTPFDVMGLGVTLLRYDTFSLSGGNQFTYELTRVVSDALSSPAKYAGRPKTNASIDRLFISYSHIDVEFLRRLMVHLKPLEKLGMIELWADTKLVAGDKWREQIELALDRSRIAILLISADFLASDFIIENELPPLLEKAENKGTRIIPVIVKPCRFLRDKRLAKFQAINNPSQPLARLSVFEQEVIYDQVAEAVEQALLKSI